MVIRKGAENILRDQACLLSDRLIFSRNPFQVETKIASSYTFMSNAFPGNWMVVAEEVLFSSKSETFAVQKGLTQGDGTEDVATIHVMFASSAHAHVASNGSSRWRGGDGSQLTLENFKLNY